MIGILAGAGIAAGNELISRIERKLTSLGLHENQEHPEIVLYQASKAPSRSMYYEGRGESFITDYINAAKRLKAFGATIACMSCNTAHAAIDEIVQESKLEFINMIEEVFKHLKQYESKKTIRIGVLCSNGSRKNSVFERYFYKYFDDQSKLIFPNDEDQELINSAILDVKQGNHRKPNNKVLEKTNLVIRNLQKNSIDHVIIGCTEISLIYKDHQLSGLIIDSMDTLIDALLERYSSKKSII
jgi:aspartate racemase